MAGLLQRLRRCLQSFGELTHQLLDHDRGDPHFTLSPQQRSELSQRALRVNVAVQTVCAEDENNHRSKAYGEVRARSRRTERCGRGKITKRKWSRSRGITWRTIPASYCRL